MTGRVDLVNNQIPQRHEAKYIRKNIQIDITSSTAVGSTILTISQLRKKPQKSTAPRRKLYI